MEIRHGIYAGLAIGFIFNPTLVRDVLIGVGAAALIISTIWLYCTGQWK